MFNATCNTLTWLTSDPLEVFFYLLSDDFRVTSKFSSLVTTCLDTPRSTRYRRRIFKTYKEVTQLSTTKPKTHNKPTLNSNRFFSNNVSLRFSGCNRVLNAFQNVAILYFVITERHFHDQNQNWNCKNKSSDHNIPLWCIHTSPFWSMITAVATKEDRASVDVPFCRWTSDTLWCHSPALELHKNLTTFLWEAKPLLLQIIYPTCTHCIWSLMMEAPWSTPMRLDGPEN